MRNNAVDVVMHIWEQGGPWISASHYLKVKNASWHLRYSHDVLYSARGSEKGGNGEKWVYKDTPAPALEGIQFWTNPKFGQREKLIC